MPNDLTIAGRSQPAMPTCERYAEALEGRNADNLGMDRHAVLIPADKLALIEAELANAMAPADTKLVPRAAAMVMGGFRKSDLQEPKVFAALLCTMLARYPDHVLRQLPQLAAERFRFPPSIAEIREMADGLIRPLQDRQVSLRQHQREHKRRERARLEAEQREAERWRQLEEHRDRLAKLYPTFPSADELDHAQMLAWEARGGVARMGEFYKLLESGRPEVPSLVTWLALVARTIGTHGWHGMVTPAHYLDLVALAQHDVVGANETFCSFSRNTTLPPASAPASTLRLHVEEAIGRAIGDAIRAMQTARAAA